jgi:hypothetical protein
MNRSAGGPSSLHALTLSIGLLALWGVGFYRTWRATREVG